MPVGSWLKDLIGNSASQIVETVGSTVDRFVHTEDERAQVQIAMQQIALELKRLEMDAEQALMEDRQSARAMYEKDSSLQKTFAIIFLSGYIGVTAFMLWWVFGMLGSVEQAQDLPNWAAGLIGTIFTAMSVKVNTIVDFLFGGSQTDAGHRDVQRQFEQAAAQRDQS